MESHMDFAEIIIGLLGGLAVFLFGMHQMSEALKAAAGEKLKNLLATLTTNRRVLIFRAPFGSWEERRRRLR